MNMDFEQIYPFLIAALVVFVIYRRFRRNFGQQLLSPVRMGVRIAVLLLVGGLLLPTAARSAAFVYALLTGLGVGILLALWGAARTRFVQADKKLYYVPHTYTGVAVSLLFLGRLVFRAIQVYGAHAPHPAGIDAAAPGMTPLGMVRSPLTFGLFFVLMGYYVCYYSLVLWKSKRVIAEAAVPAAAAGGS